MSGLGKRVDALEQKSGSGKKVMLWPDYASDGGLVHEGKFYPDVDALLCAKGLDRDDVYIFTWNLAGNRTAAELLAEAEERAKNPPPEVSIDDLGEYGRKLVEEDGVSPAVAQHLDRLRNDPSYDRKAANAFYASL